MKDKRKISWEKPFGIASVLIIGTLYLCDRAGLIDAKKFIPLMFLLLAVDIFARISDNKKTKERFQEHSKSLNKTQEPPHARGE